MSELEDVCASISSLQLQYVYWQVFLIEIFSAASFSDYALNNCNSLELVNNLRSQSPHNLKNGRHFSNFFTKH